jgi:hypothetical protein
MRHVAIAAMSFLACIEAASADPGGDGNPAPFAFAPDLDSNLYVQGDFTLSSLRDNLVVPFPSPAPPQWEARAFLDARVHWRLNEALSFVYSGRFNLRAEDGLDFPDHEDVRNDLRESYFAWQSGDGLFFLEAGRINLKSGVALGFNPTDYFKTRAVVEPVSADPTVLREDRLGTAMLLGQTVWSGGSLTMAVAPKLASDSAPYLNDNLPGFNPTFDRTNARTRILIKASFDLPDAVSSEILAYGEAAHPRYGLNLTRSFGQSVVGYLEWSGGRRASLADDAFADGFRNGVLPPEPPLPVSDDRDFASDLAVGASYATKVGINFDLEYDFHQAGFSGADWRNWFAAGRSSSPFLPGELWFIRGYAADQQEPMARHGAFLRADWRNVFVRDLSLAGFVDSDLRDGSGLGQFTADYYLSPQWTVGALVDVDFGRRRSDFGSLPQSTSVLARICRYL